ncbi:MAG: hypothetical protein APF81_27630 [Desulfosporosinus sp. BRH_c37]|nr:MAG: hypothetical protein APF81_27630 [Desulfosporosinus sp. BRH_c37]
MLEGLMVLIAIAFLVVTLISDAGSAKKKHSKYFQTVQKPTKKTVREVAIPDLSKHDGFFAKLNKL